MSDDCTCGHGIAWHEHHPLSTGEAQWPRRFRLERCVVDDCACREYVEASK